MSGRIVQLSLSPRGGVPRRAMAGANITGNGIAGDAVRLIRQG